MTDVLDAFVYSELRRLAEDTKSVHEFEQCLINPDAILALLDELERLKHELKPKNKCIHCGGAHFIGSEALQCSYEYTRQRGHILDTCTCSNCDSIAYAMSKGWSPK